MPRNNADFFHGSNHRFQVGDTVVPGADGSAWASTNREVAAGYGSNVYRVEPIEDATPHPGAAKRFGIHYSKQGYKVLGEG